MLGLLFQEVRRSCIYEKTNNLNAAEFILDVLSAQQGMHINITVSLYQTTNKRELTTQEEEFITWPADMYKVLAAELITC